MSKRFINAWPLLVTCLLSLVTIIGCAGKNIQVAPDAPIQKEKSEFLLRYGFFVTEREMKNGYPDLPEPIKSFEQINTPGELEKFIKHFWFIRDTDPFTEINEYKELIDGRIRDIENDIFSQDVDAPTHFRLHGGLRGDLARVYLLNGPPSFKARLPEGAYHSELIVWYYIDARGRHLMRFLFYERYNRFQVFKNYGAGSLNIGFALRDISRNAYPSDRELIELWNELDRSDPEWIFRVPLIEFSSFPDVVIEGARAKQFGALDPPDPLGLTILKPEILGQPEDVGTRPFIYSRFHSFIPAYLRIINSIETNKPYFSMILGFPNLDWELKNDTAESALELRISFQNKDTKALKEFFTRLTVTMLKDYLTQNANQHFFMPLDIRQNLIGENQTLGQLISALEPGSYVVNVYFKHSVTKKYNAWREEILIQ